MVLKKKSMLSAVLASSLVFSGLAPYAVIQAESFSDVGSRQVTQASYPQVLITELLPNSVNVPGKSADAFEFIELYNNRSEAIQLSDIKLVYGYPDGRATDWQFVENKEILPGETMVVWVKNDNNAHLTNADFNEAFGTTIPDAQLTYVETAGMANTAERTMSVADQSGMIFTTVRYTKDQVVENKSIRYRLTADGTGTEAYPELTAPNPGTVQAEQLPEAPVEVDGELPVITHTPVQTADSAQALSIEAEVTDNNHVQAVKLFYRSVNEGVWLEKEMNRTAGDNFAVEIPAEELYTKQLTYRIEAFDGQNTASTSEYTIQIEGQPFDPQAVPTLLVTELVPDSTNVGSLDGYEFVEVYNNSSQAINLNDYTIRYRYTMEGPQADLLWKPEVKDVILPSGETMVFWVINSANGAKTVDDFNANYGVQLTENVDIVKLHVGGMANSSPRGLAIATNAGEDISVASYFDDPKVDDTQPDKGIQYTFPREPGNKEMKKYSPGLEPATPGSVATVQVPSVKVQLPVDTQPPTVDDLTAKGTVSDKQNVTLTFDAQDDHSVKTVQLFYKTKEEDAFSSVYLTKNYDSKLFTHKIFSPELLGKKGLHYYVSVSDGTNVVDSPLTTIAIENESYEDIGLNIGEGAFIRDQILLKAYGHDASLLIDNEDVTAETFAALPGQAYFAFDVKKVNLYFKNGVTIGDEILHIFDDTINTYQTLTIPVDPKYFTPEEATKIAIRSGTKVSPFDPESEENRDDFYVKNVRLVLEDGTTLYDPAYANAEKELLVGDGSGAKEAFEFAFTIPAEKYTAKAYRWDTTAVQDGAHVIEAKGSIPAMANIIVDNVAPTITPSIEEGKTYKGEFTIHAEVTDEHSGVSSLTAILDEQEITLPYETSSAKLAAGAHSVTYKAVDTAGNEAEKTIHFTVVEEKPYVPEPIAPKDGAIEVNPDGVTLKVQVADPTEDTLDVAFFEGFEISATDEQMLVFENSSDTEPPKTMIPAGEVVVSDKEKLAKVDGEYIETSSMDQFPYHRFEVELDEQVSENDEIVLNWEGKSHIGRKVSMYVWNNAIDKWELRDWKIAKDTSNFKLTGSVVGNDYILDGKVQVLVQDEIAATTEFDYSFIWMSDTQYYAESYPYIFDRMTKWIAEIKDELNVKYVFHTGDLVDKAHEPIQWQRADAYMGTLEQANIPYGVLAGNHDVGHKTGDYDEYGKYFGEQRFNGKDYYGESYKNNRGHYDVISANGNDFIMVYMGWGVNDEDIAWINKVLAENPHRKAILSFHEYLLVSGNRSPIGDQVYEEVVMGNPNVIAVLSGHYHDSETLIDEIDDDGDGIADRKVYQMLADYQGGPEGGQGFMRLLKVNPLENQIHVQTYSPYLDQYNYYNPVDYPGKDEFTIDVDLTPVEKLVATDFFEVEVFTNTEIGTDTGIENGEVAQANWTNLLPTRKHGWYTKVSDAFGGEVRSSVWSFVTGQKEVDNGDDNGNVIVPELPPTDGETVQVTMDSVQKSEKAWKVTASKDADMKWQLTDEVVKAAHEANVPVVFEMKKGHAVTLPVDVLQAATDEKVTVELAVKEKTDDTASNEQATIVKTAGNKAISVQTSGDFSSTGKATSIQATEKSDKVKLLSDVLAVRVTIGNKPVNLALPIQLKVKGALDRHQATGASWRDGKWIYAGGTEKAGTWTMHTSPSTVAVVSKTPNFKDTQAHWAKEEIDSLYARLLTQGKTESVFAPDAQVSRAEFAVLLARVFQLPLETYEGKFTDVPASKQWAAQSIEAAHRAGITLGKHDGTFDPDANITREQMAAMLVRAIKSERPELLKEDVADISFNDNHLFSQYAKDAIQQAAAIGLINGRSNGKFDPKHTATRAETAVVLYRMLDL